jgi:hypothetical protein
MKHNKHMQTGIKNLKSIPLKSFLLRFAIFAAGWLVLLGGQQLRHLVRDSLFSRYHSYQHL